MVGPRMISFAALPETVDAVKYVYDQVKSDPYMVTALAVSVLCNYKEDPEETFQMIDVLKGPSPLSNFGKQFIQERLKGKEYKPFSFIQGTSPANGYTVAAAPYRIPVGKSASQPVESNYCTMLVYSTGADSPRSIMLRQKGGTEWCLTDITILGDIRVPAAEDPWA